MSMKTCRWGIMGAAVIAQKNWQAIRNSGNAVVAAVASRDPSKAAAFIADRQRECSFETTPISCNYEELLSNPEIDAVYIPLPTGLRKEWVIRAAEAGKHVLCEKPCAIHSRELKQMLDACQANQVQFMDGVMFMHSQRLPALRRVLDDSQNSIGKIRRMSSHFSFLAPDEFLQNNIRMSSQLEPHGSLGDLGWYSIRMALWTMNYAMPTQVSAQLLAQQGRADSPNAVPLELTAELKFPGDVSFGFFSSFLVDQQQTFTISGTNGSIYLDDFVLPSFGSSATFDVIKNDFQVSGCQFNLAQYRERVAVKEFSNNHPTSQETNLFRTFSEIVLSGKTDQTWPDFSRKTQLVLDACMESAQNGGKIVTIKDK
ncbi:Gfo/Idh/MocA family protein [Planctomicrobium sp. SH527]|uniref:Gfo/Idh/MocA family protein n=1 Tax=Planctomicrobium sp. SH527 TaxID=3448123 RepID=UPI003F5C2018